MLYRKGRQMISIRQMQKNDESQIVALMQKFYASSAVWSNGSEEIFRADVRECVGDSPYARGYVFECDGKMAGYGMLAFGFSTEFGKKCVWIEDIYVKEEFRGMKLGSRFLDLVQREFPQFLHRLELEKENATALHVYHRAGFRELPYISMFRNGDV